ncbi:AraC family transcriptional regulator [Caulobacter sp.]|uniref:AraC family transcriptional regulator n=1 Tax=Caulobacter sp. TaxID=78 RepID=UPI001B2574BA|nr:AraC family transcriptional regulator [Caulobacter sp.]MBO9545905.1 AraC family transcriptional regulator [Caulobacter sp.]
MSDALSDLAALLRVRPELEDYCRFGGDWRVEHEASAAAQFHIVAKGQCVVTPTGREAVVLSAGDILLLPRGDAHVLRPRITAEQATRPISTRYHNAIRIKEAGDGAPDTELICGLLHFEATAAQLPVSALPDVIVLRAGQDASQARFVGLVAAMHDEIEQARVGAVAIAMDLASALFVMFLRAHLEADPPAEGLLALLAHRATAAATLAMLREPGEDWSLDALADLAGASRATLVRQFRKIAGQSPLGFLSELRLNLGRQRLRRGDQSIAQIAAELGYQSESAFSRAVHRRFGERPGAIRRG